MNDLVMHIARIVLFFYFRCLVFICMTPQAAEFELLSYQNKGCLLRSLKAPLDLDDTPTNLRTLGAIIRYDIIYFS